MSTISSLISYFQTEVAPGTYPVNEIMASRIKGCPQAYSIDVENLTEDGKVKIENAAQTNIREIFRTRLDLQECKNRVWSHSYKVVLVVLTGAVFYYNIIPIQALFIVINSSDKIVVPFVWVTSIVIQLPRNDAYKRLKSVAEIALGFVFSPLLSVAEGAKIAAKQVKLLRLERQFDKIHLDKISKTLPAVCFNHFLSKKGLILSDARKVMLSLSESIKAAKKDDVETVFLRFVNGKSAPGNDLLAFKINAIVCPGSLHINLKDRERFDYIKLVAESEGVLNRITSNAQDVDLEMIFTLFPLGSPQHEEVIKGLLSNSKCDLMRYFIDNIEKEWVQKVIQKKWLDNSLRQNPFLNALGRIDDVDTKIKITKCLKNHKTIISHFIRQIPGINREAFNQWEAFIAVNYLLTFNNFEHRYQYRVFETLLKSESVVEKEHIKTIFSKFRTCDCDCGSEKDYFIFFLLQNFHQQWAFNVLHNVIAEKFPLDLNIVYDEFDEKTDALNQWIKEIRQSEDYPDRIFAAHLSRHQIETTFLKDNLVKIPEDAEIDEDIDEILELVKEEIKAERDDKDYQCRITLALSQFPVYRQCREAYFYYDLESLERHFTTNGFIDPSNRDNVTLADFTYDIALGKKIREKARRIIKEKMGEKSVFSRVSKRFMSNFNNYFLSNPK